MRRIGTGRLTVWVAIAVIMAPVLATAVVHARAPLVLNYPDDPCPVAAITDLQLARYAQVDEVRVWVADPTGSAAATLVRVENDEFGRSLQVGNGIEQTLHFSPSLGASEFRVSLDPVFEAPAGVCVERVELAYRGALVAAIDW